MTLDELFQRAVILQDETVAFCTGAGFPQTASDITGPFERVIKSSAILWARDARYPFRPTSTTETTVKMIARMADAIEVYLVAKDQGIDEALLWKLGKV